MFRDTQVRLSDAFRLALLFPIQLMKTHKLQRLDHYSPIRLYPAGKDIGGLEMVVGKTAPLKILGFGTYDSQKQPRIQVLLDGLSEAGFTVDTLNAPLGYTVMESVRAVQSPIHTLGFAFRIAKRWSRLILSRIIRRPQPDIVLVRYLAQLDVVLARVLFPKALLVTDYLVSLRETALDRRITGRLRMILLTAVDQIAIRVSDIVVVDTEEQLLQIREPAREKVVVVPVGATNEWFESEIGSFPAEERPLSVIFFGLFTPLQGAPVIAECARLVNSTNNKILFTFVGRGQDYDECTKILKGVPGLVWKDWLSLESLISEVSRHHVCLGIFGTTPKAQRVAPTKGFQGMASGRVLVTSDSPPQRRIFKSGAVYVPVGSAESLASVLGCLDANREYLQQRAKAARIVAEKYFRPVEIIKPLERKIAEVFRWPSS